VALKDLFSGFFVVEEEDDDLKAPPEEEQNHQQNKQQAQSQTNYNNQQTDNTERQRLQSVPKKQPTRLQQSTGERKYQMNNSAPKNNTRNVVNMNNQDQNNYDFAQESSKMCLF